MKKYKKVYVNDVNAFYIKFNYGIQLSTPKSKLYPYTTLFRSCGPQTRGGSADPFPVHRARRAAQRDALDEREKRSEEHTSELQSRRDLVCRLLLEKKK